MQIDKTMDVYTQDGDRVGNVERFVLRPDTNEITHVVVNKGLFFPSDRVVPVSLIAESEDDRLILSGEVDDPNAFMEFEETYFVRSTEDSEGSELPIAYYWYPPSDINFWNPAGALYSPRPDYLHREIERNIPAGTVPLEEGAKVFSADDEHVGNVDSIITPAEQETPRATHIIISQGLLFKERKAIPITWIARIGEEKIHLMVDTELLERLPAYETASA